MDESRLPPQRRCLARRVAPWLPILDAGSGAMSVGRPHLELKLWRFAQGPGQRAENCTDVHPANVAGAEPTVTVTREQHHGTRLLPLRPSGPDVLDVPGNLARGGMEEAQTSETRPSAADRLSRSAAALLVHLFVDDEKDPQRLVLLPSTIVSHHSLETEFSTDHGSGRSSARTCVINSSVHRQPRRDSTAA